MSQLGDLYAEAHRIVLDRYAKEKDKLGRSQVWKIDTLNEDRKADKNTGLVETYIDEVEDIVEKLLAGQLTEKEVVRIAAEPMSPAKPHWFMGKSYRRDAKNDRWRKAKQQKSQKKFRPNISIPQEDEPFNTKIGGLNDYSYQT